MPKPILTPLHITALAWAVEVAGNSFKDEMSATAVASLCEAEEAIAILRSQMPAPKAKRGGR